MFQPMRVVAAILLLTAANAAPQNLPTKIPSTARFDLFSDCCELTGASVTYGRASFERPSWRPEVERVRGYTVNFPVVRFRTNEFAFTFVPKSNGTVTLTLTGPWEEASKGLLYQQEVLWDEIEITGARFTNEQWMNSTKPVRTWQRKQQALSLQVRDGIPVTVRAKARPAIPPAFRDMQRIIGQSPAHRAAAQFMRGVNLGNYLEAPPRQDWGAHYSTADFVQMRSEGLDHVRLPVAWHHYAGPAPDFKLSDEIFGKADFLVTNALNNKLHVIINLHHFDDFTTAPAAHMAKLYALWQQIAQHYAGHPDSVAFELLNEPKDAATTVVLNPIYAELIRQIRVTNPRRTIFLGPGKWNQVSELSNLLLPDKDENLIVTVHCYDPFQFTHQGAGWAGSDRKLRGIRFPGPPETALVPEASLKLSASALEWLKRYNTLPADQNPSSPAAFRPAIETAKEWSDYYGRPVHFGEFGCYIGADSASRARFYAEFRKALDEAGLGWAVWDWKAGFRYWDDRKQAPAEGMREALFPDGTASRR
jgi:endoglucanase